jgi:hypothetical protein
MTRQEFDNAFRAHIDNTAGYTRRELTAINDAVFAMTRDLDLDDDRTKSFVDYKFERAFEWVDLS